MVEANLNLNQAECIKEVSNFGNTVYVNICNGTTSVVSWSSFDIALGIFLGIFLISIIIFFIYEG
jgi:hypothetical protein